MNKTIKYLYFLLFVVFLPISLNAQVVTTNPAIFTADQSVTITYDATQSQGQALVGISGNIKMHSGAVTAGAGSSAWDPLYVKGAWGDPASVGTATPVSGQPNKWSITITPRTYYGVPAGTPIFRLGIVFRENGPCGGFGGAATACKEGKNAQGSDIFIDVNQGGLAIAFTNPTNSGFFVNNGDGVTISATSNVSATLKIFLNNVEVASQNNATTISFNVSVTNATPLYNVTVSASGGNPVVTDTKSTYFVLRQNSATQALPANVIDGINYDPNDATKATFVLTAPDKKFVYLVGSFNNWQISPTYMMKRTPSYGGSGAGSNPTNNKYWVEVTGLTSGVEYTFQYYVYDNAENLVKIGDPYCEKVLDEGNDQFIPASIYPNPTPYPTGKTTGTVSVMQTGQTPYNWSAATTNFVRPDKRRLQIYELLVRDFDATSSYQAVIDRLDYIQNLGINALQLMPIMEFEGNISWGYNVTYFCALDKAYGTKNKLKELIDKCHQRGIAVILDIALNHAYGDNPYARMYYNGNRPATNNPWFNEYPKHPFNVGNDFNHDSQYTRNMVDQVIKYWINEYKIDGYRFDLIKGFTQTQTCDNVGANCNVGTWNNNDGSRQFNIKRMADVLWATSPNLYIILEFLATGGQEEADYANYQVNDNTKGGMMLWRNMDSRYSQNIMGFNTDHYIGDADFANNPNGSGVPFQQPRVVSYSESHDEERNVYKAKTSGKTNNPSHNVQNIDVALDRAKALAAMNLPIVGPKMIWQFGELGYDFSINNCENGTINNDCRTSPKPIRWDYFDNANRKRLYKVYAALNKLKITYDAFMSTDNFIIEDAGYTKQLKITPQPYNGNPTSPNNMNILIIANFDIAAQNVNAQFHHTGTWFNVFDEGSSFNVTSTSQTVNLQPGEFRMYVDVAIPANMLPEGGLVAYTAPGKAINPLATALSQTSIRLDWTDISGETAYRIFRAPSINGTYTQVGTDLAGNVITFTDNGLTANTQYFYKIVSVNSFGTRETAPFSATTNAAGTPNAPTNLVATPSHTSAANLSITLNWTDNATDETGFIVTRSNTSGGTFTQIGTQLAANTTTYIDNTVVAGQTYFYKACAVKTAAPNSCSVEASSGIIIAPAIAPSNVVLTPNVATPNIRVNWTDNSTDESGFIIQRTTTAGSNYTQVGTVGANIATFTDANVMIGTTYFYRVCATKTGTSNACSAEVGLPTPLSIEQNSISSALLVFPNPTSDRCQVSLKNVNFSKAHIEVLDIMGKVVTKLPMENDTQEVNMENMPSGVYFLRVTTDKGQGVKRVLKK